ncbi:hypothetical protein DDM66_18020 [Vibrio cholerae]|nr:hypothetical protein [Vibrio cholerae]
MMKEQDKEKSRIGLTINNIALWGVIAFLVLVVLPIALEVKEPFQAVLISLGTSIFIALTITFLVNKKIASVTNYEVKELIQSHFPKLLAINELGLEQVTYKNGMESLGVDIVDSPELFVVMNDGKNFFTNNSKELSARFKKEDRRTVVILLSDESESESVLNKRNGKSEDGYYARKIRESIKDYMNFHQGSPESNHLEIYKYSFNFTMSIVATTEIAVIGTYRNAAGKSLVPPHFVFRNVSENCEYQNIKSDVENLIKQSQKCD